MQNFEFRNPTKIVFGRGARGQGRGRSGGDSQEDPAALRQRRHQDDRSLRSRHRFVAQGRRRMGRTGRRQAEPAPEPGLRGNPPVQGRRVSASFWRSAAAARSTRPRRSPWAPLRQADVWDFYLGKGAPAAALPVGTVLTIPAAGSEASTGTVITNEEGWLKRAVNSELIYPRFSILNPELAFTLPPSRSLAARPTSWRT